MRHDKQFRLPITSRFQSTHPLRDATVLFVCIHATPVISIHAPLTGCDVVFLFHQNQNLISIHAPLTGCDLRCRPRLILCFSISIHAPLTGCDLILFFPVLVILISIHAPLTGCDEYFLCYRLTMQYFNPRTPYGMRLI